MRFSIQKVFIYFIICVAVGYPVFVWFGNVNLALESKVLNPIFRVMGLVAFSIMWLHVVGSAFEAWVSKYINFKSFVDYSSICVLFLIILHPLLLLVSLKINNSGSLFDYGKPIYIWLAIVGWLMLITYDIRKLFNTRAFFIKHWGLINKISTLGFYVVFFHSLGIGSDLQKGALKIVWVFYGVSAFCASIYTNRELINKACNKLLQAGNKPI